MQWIQVIAAAVAIIYVVRVLALWKTKKMSTSGAVLWLVVWGGVLFVIFATPVLNRISVWIGVGRAVDLVVYAAIILAFYLVFQLNMRVSRLEKDLTKVVRKVAMKKK